jgi:general secretion pathway protein I
MIRLRTKYQGFSLLEVLVAFVVISFSLAILMRIFSGALNNLVAAEGYMQALAVAESQFSAAAGQTSLREGETFGKDDQGRNWRLAVSSYHEADSSLADVALPIVLYRVDIEVQWGEREGKSRSLRLATLMNSRKVE